MALINDEFGADIDLEGLLALGRFQGVRQYLHEQSGINVPANNERAR